MTVIRPLDAVPEPTREDVLGMKARLDGAGITSYIHIFAEDAPDQEMVS
ncbi:MAG: hypothetical protein OXJ55_18585 [Caldilineaceae bacterium]|nr:hypothetical protein [Caldilineaceae bacterium]MDE0463777.1 hypothetical protein [Caldilineaceae bacterium]